MATSNKAWHDAHPMPEKATETERVAWHAAHAEACACRPIPASLTEAVWLHQTGFPKIGAPAHRALAGAGITHLTQLSNYTEAEIAGLHGMGQKGIRLLKEKLAEQGLTFKGV